jgi:hypothetical protein
MTTLDFKCNIILSDRIFWIYFIITIFVIIIGVTFIVTSSNLSNANLLILICLWIITNICLMIMIYLSSYRLGPSGICVIDPDSNCFSYDNRIWLFVNIIYVLLLIISILWGCELNNTDPGPLRDMSGILILLGGILLIGLSIDRIYSVLFWISFLYLLIWYILTLYTVLN